MDEGEQPQTGLFNNFAVTLAVVAGSFLLLLIILVYIHFDAAITKFVEDTKNGFNFRIKAFKRYLKVKTTLDQNMLNKAPIFAKMRMIGRLQVAAAKKQQQETEMKNAISGLAAISIISTSGQAVTKCESSSTVVASDLTSIDLGVPVNPI